ncbi:MAG: EamA family transporter [Chromatiales bacterium]|jgi:drug/metabolite transporter (DMT)-like permease|nr:EamA family transporter [Chromatiales bacterium]
MWNSLALLMVVTVLYAGYNLMVKISSQHAPEVATTTVMATITLQLAALVVSLGFAGSLFARGGHVFELTPPAYLWAIGAGLCIGAAEVAYFYLFRGAVGRPSMSASVAIPAVVAGTVVLSLLCSSLFLNERLNAVQLGGGLLILLGVGVLFAGSSTDL